MNLNLSLLAIDTITPTRDFNLLYVALDTLFLLVFIGLLVWKKRYSTVIFALFGGVLYTVVDYCGFYLGGSRIVSINGDAAGAGNTFLVLLWMSMSYGITNFAFMWTLIRKDPLRKYWIFMIIMWWMVCPSMSELGTSGAMATAICTYRTTGAYHGWMAVVMATQWIALIVILMMKEHKKAFVDIIKLCVIGFTVQFGWEFALLINGIRPLDGASIQTLIVNSFIETNMCMPTTYLVYYLWSHRFNEDMTRAPEKPLFAWIRKDVPDIEAEDSESFTDKLAKAIVKYGGKQAASAADVEAAEANKDTRPKETEDGAAKKIPTATI